MLDPVGFWSYGRHDDEHSDGALSQLRIVVGNAINMQHGAKVKLFQDKEAIAFGADWAAEIDRAIGQTNFYLPIVTPRFLKSRYCHAEFQSFRRRMEALGYDDLIFPVHYVDVEDISVKDTVFGDDLELLRRSQWIDFRPLFYADPRSAEVRQWAGGLASSILGMVRLHRIAEVREQERQEQAAREVGERWRQEGAERPEAEESEQRGPSKRELEERRRQAEPSHKLLLFVKVILGSTLTVAAALGFWFALRPNLTQLCDRLAASPFDQDRPAHAAGVPFEAIDGKAAIQACHVAFEAASGERRIAYQLGRALQAGRQFDEARISYEKAAYLGSAVAMNSLGALYATGQGTAQDYAIARYWYVKAADRGNPNAMNNLGELYYYGQGVAQDHAAARSWYMKAADHGNPNAMNNLGWLYATGQGTAQDYAAARSWYERAADRGNPDAMNRLGELYAKGNGAAQDYAVARTWYEKAADRGNSNAMNNLGELYANGKGVTQDYIIARSWYERAVDNGSLDAMNNLGWLYYEGHGVAKDYVMGQSWFKKAADRGNVNAMTSLSFLYRFGVGVAPDIAAGLDWIEKVKKLEGERLKKNFTDPKEY